MKVPYVLISTVVLLLGLSACRTTTESNVESISGSGNIVTEEREITNFSRIQIYLGADLDLTQGDTTSLSIEADDNLLQYIKTEIRSDSLIVTKPDSVNLSPSQPIHLQVAFSTLSSIEINGRSAIIAENLDLDNLTVSFSGAGSTEFSGRIDTQTVSIRGEATIHNFNVVSQEVSADISGRGTLNVNAEDSLDVTVSGQATVRYTGNPVVTQNVSGSVDIAPQQSE